MARKPSKEELKNRILPHVRHHANNAACILLWKGYLAAMMEWGIIEPNDYHELNGMLGDTEEDLRRELFLGYPGQYE